MAVGWMEHEAWRRFYTSVDSAYLNEASINLLVSKCISEALDWALIGYDHYPSSLRSHVPELETILLGEVARITTELGQNVALEFVLPVFTEASFSSSELGIRGRVDLVYKSQTGYEPWDIKTGKPPSEMTESYKLQVAAYALLIEANYKCEVKSGGIFLTGLRVSRSFPISQELREKVVKIAVQIRNMLQTGDRPAVERLTLSHCDNCGFRQICQELTGKKREVQAD